MGEATSSKKANKTNFGIYPYNHASVASSEIEKNRQLNSAANPNKNFEQKGLERERGMKLQEAAPVLPMKDIGTRPGVVIDTIDQQVHLGLTPSRIIKLKRVNKVAIQLLSLVFVVLFLFSLYNLGHAGEGSGKKPTNLSALKVYDAEAERRFENGPKIWWSEKNSQVDSIEGRVEEVHVRHGRNYGHLNIGIGVNERAAGKDLSIYGSCSGNNTVNCLYPTQGINR